MSTSMFKNVKQIESLEKQISRIEFYGAIELYHKSSASLAKIKLCRKNFIEDF